MKNSFYLLASLILMLVACDKDSDATDPIAPSLTQSEIVTSLLASFESLDTSKVLEYIHPSNFIQHNLEITDGQEGMINAVLEGPLRGANINTVRMWEDGDHVITHNEINLDGNAIVGFNIFRFSSDKIIEHWDNRQANSMINDSGHSMTDGPTETIDLAETEANKTLVTSFIEEILIGEKHDLLSDYFNNNDYIQHNPTMQDSLSNLQHTLENMSEQGSTFSYQTLHKVLGQGNFVLALSEGSQNGVDAAFYDLFRIEGGKLAEHWDVIQVIPQENTWANTNGKF